MSSQPGSAKIPREVKPAECALLDSPETVARYEKVRELLAVIADKLPSVAEGAAFAKACVDLDKLATKLTQERYRIGFIGISQGGKSTTAGYVVGATGDADNPAPPGGDGKAATAIATRILPVKDRHPKCLANEDHFVELVYLTKEQLRDRVRQIFGILEIEPAPDHAPELWLEQCREYARINPKDNVPDREVAARLLEAAMANPDLVKPSPVIEPGSFDLEFRKKCVLHPEKGQPASKYALLREMRIWYHTERAPESLELIDLPGLAVARVSDETLTMAFLPELNGAFLFQEQGQLESESAAKLTAKMRREYGDMIGGRIWMVVTKCDLFREDDEKQDLSNPAGKFKTIADKTRDSGIVLENVVLVSNPVYRAVLRGATAPDAWVEAKGKWMPTFDAHGQPVEPEAVKSQDGLREAFRDLVLAGGVPRISDHMKQRVEAAIRSETQDEAQIVLTRVVAKIRHDLNSAKQRGGMKPEEVVTAMKMQRSLDRLAKEYVASDTHIRSIYDNVTRNLLSLHDDLGYANDDYADRDGHMGLCTALMKRAMALAEDQSRAVVDKVQKKVDETLAADKTHASLEKAVPQITSARLAFADACQRLREGKSTERRSFRDTVFGTFVMDDTLLSRFQWSGSNRITGQTHDNMMTKKIHVVSQAHASELSSAIAEALKELAATYRALARDNSDANTTQTADLDAVINKLNGYFS